MSGTLGLTVAGQQLDESIHGLADKMLRRRLIKFANKATTMVKQVHNTADWTQDSKESMLTILRDFYLKEICDRFPRIDDQAFYALRNYIKSIATPEFTPETRTQLAIQDRQQFARVRQAVDDDSNMAMKMVLVGLFTVWLLTVLYVPLIGKPSPFR
jgi:hypothetical protein